MANEEHLKLLKAGVEGWNRWRERVVGLTPDLSHGNLCDLQLSDANLEGADLQFASFARSVLTGAVFDYSNSAGAVFNDANLDNAHFREARIDGAQFPHAKLNRAVLSVSNASYANFKGASLRDGVLYHARPHVC
jgi:uncharacterized protein YjbI with pentapeptide repeats